jgi:hypothetical protein
MRILLSLGVAALADAARLTIDPMKHSVPPITRSDFDSVINKVRDRMVSAVFYYKPEDADSVKYFDPFNQVATELRGMFKFAAVNCDDQEKLCKDEGVATDGQFPQVVVYPMRPFPAEPLPREDFDKLADEKGLKKLLYRLLSSEFVKTLTEESVDAFLSHDEHIPKVILLSNRKVTPPLFKAISTEFHREMEFGFFPNPSDAMMKKFKVKSIPRIVLQDADNKGKRRTQIYDGDLTYAAIHEWANLRRETFARGGGFDHTQSGTSGEGAPSAPLRPWMSQEVPEMYKASHKDICFRFDEGLCAIYIKDGEITDGEVGMIKRIKAGLIDESVKFRFMWMDVAKETGFRELFGAQTLPNFVVFNPHKRIRFAGPMEEAASDSTIKNLIEKIASGEGRFKVVPGQQLPAFADRKTTGTSEKEEL